MYPISFFEVQNYYFFLSPSNSKLLPAHSFHPFSLSRSNSSPAHSISPQLVPDSSKTLQTFEFSDVFQRSYFWPVVRRLAGILSAEHLQPPPRSYFHPRSNRWQIQNCGFLVALYPLWSNLPNVFFQSCHQLHLILLKKIIYFKKCTNKFFFVLISRIYQKCSFFKQKTCDHIKKIARFVEK